MSAAEKLKALDADVGAMSRDMIDGGAEAEWGHDWYMRFAALGVALPQIVAVVETAEKSVRWESVTSAIGVEVARNLWAALAALEEALT